MWSREKGKVGEHASFLILLSPEIKSLFIFQEIQPHPYSSCLSHYHWSLVPWSSSENHRKSLSLIWIFFSFFFFTTTGEECSKAPPGSVWAGTMWVSLLSCVWWAFQSPPEWDPRSNSVHQVQHGMLSNLFCQAAFALWAGWANNRLEGTGGWSGSGFWFKKINNSKDKMTTARCVTKIQTYLSNEEHG